MRTALLLVALLLAAVPRPARACSCDMSRPQLIAPADGAIDVPQDALLWIGDGGYVEEATPWLQVLDASTGAPRTGSFRPIADPWVKSLAFAFDPPLAEGEVVQLRHADGRNLTTFTVGGRATSPAPGVAFVGPATFATVWADAGSSCAPVVRLATVGVGPSGVLAVIDTSGLATAGDGPVAAGIAAIGEPAGVNLGMGDCRYGWPDAAPGAELTVRVGTFALNGRFSGWSEPVTLTFPSDPPMGAEHPTGEGHGPRSDGADDTGCAAAPGRPTAALLPAALALLLLRRR